jgi:pyruvate/2-oxoglutarate dehydrogenase complex dihydrolipoamide dehydrogenase (E3) component
MTEKADVIVLGMGPGGEDLGGKLAVAGLDVVGIERNLVGGECPYWGCVPSKMMIRAANLLAEARRIDGIAGSSVVNPDWSPVAARIRAEATDNWNDKVAVDRFEGKGGRFIRGAASFTGPRTVSVDGNEIEAERGVVIATGTTAAVPPIAGLADTHFWTNHEAIEADTLPESIIVLGAGAVGAELAQVFARFGVKVTVVELFDRILFVEEPEASAVVTDSFEADGIEVIVGADTKRVSYDGGFTLELEDGRTVQAERLLVTTGRQANLPGLDVAKAGLDPEAKFVKVDNRMRAGDGLWAVGDVTGEGAFTHVAMYQSGIAVADILGKPTHDASYHALPRVTFTDPEVGSVGLNEAQARDEGLDVAVATAAVPSTARGWLHKAGNEGIIKLVADSREGVLVGATSAGPMGGEVLSMLTLAVHARLPITTLRSMIYAYPTFHRGVEDALRDLDV